MNVIASSCDNAVVNVSVVASEYFCEIFYRAKCLVINYE